MPRRKVIRFIINLILFFGTISAVADTWYLIYSRNRSIAPKIAAAFPGMEIRGGKLRPSGATPYSPPAWRIIPIINQVMGLPATYRHDADSFVVVDTATSSPLPSKVPVLLLKKDEMVVAFAPNNSMKFSYENLLLGTPDLVFTAEDIGRFLKSHQFSIFFGYLISTVIHLGTLFLSSIFFLAFAAYIFRVEPKRTLKEYLKISMFAITPVVIGTTMISLSGVRLEWAWHIFILVSTVVMFRAITAISSPGKPTEEF